MANAIFRAKLVRDGGIYDGLPVVPEAGDFDVTRGVDTAAANAYNVSAATLQAALEGLSTIGAGNIAVDSNNNGYCVLRTGGATGGSVTLSSVTIGNVQLDAPFTSASIIADSLPYVVLVTETAANEFLIEWTDVNFTSATFELTDSTTGGSGASAFALNDEGEITSWQLTFQGSLANTDINDLSVTGNLLRYKADTLTVDDSATDGLTPIQEVQIITLDAVPTAGNFVINGITVGSGGTTFGAGTVENAIEDAGGANKACGVTGTDDVGPFTVTYDTPANVSDSLLDFTGSTLTLPATFTISTTQGGSGGQNEIQNIITNATEGTFTLSFSGLPVIGTATTGTLNFNDNAATVQAAINAVLDDGQTVSCAGTLAGGMTVEFTGDLELLDVDEMTHTPVASLLRNVGISVATDTQGRTGNPQVATVSRDANATEGSLKVTVNAVDSDAFAFDADATAVNTALDAQGIAFTASGTAPNWTFTADVNAVNVTFTATEVTALRGDADIVLVEVQAGSEEVASGGGFLLLFPG